MITATPMQVAEDASSLITVVTEPKRSVNWTLTGSGTLTVLTDHTDAAGRAFAKYTPGVVGETARISAEYGA